MNHSGSFLLMLNVVIVCGFLIVLLGNNDLLRSSESTAAIRCTCTDLLYAASGMYTTLHTMGLHYTRDELLSHNNHTTGSTLISTDVCNVIKSLKLKRRCSTRRKCRGGRNFQRPIPVIITPPSGHSGNVNVTVSAKQSKPNHNNLINVPLIKNFSSCDAESCSSLRIGLLNARSVANKATEINELIVDQCLDILFITETWLKESGNGTSITDLVPTGYTLHHNPRDQKRGGGVGVIHRDFLELKCKTANPTNSYEHQEYVLHYANRYVQFLLVYRPPDKSIPQFLDEIQDHLSVATISGAATVLVGDLNIHLDKHEDPHIKRFNEVITNFDLTQIVDCPTHKKGHILDLVCLPRFMIDNNGDSPQKKLNLSANDNAGSDHYLVSFDLPVSIKKSSSVNHAKILIRNIRGIDREKFISDVHTSTSEMSSVGASEAFRSFHKVLQTTLDDHAPAKSVQPKIRQSEPWMSKEVHAARALRRRCEARWRSSRLEVHRQIYSNQVKVTSAVIKDAKREFYTSKLSNPRYSQRELFSTFSKLTSSLPAPSSKDTPDLELAEKFANYFDQKIVKIRHELDNDITATDQSSCATPVSGNILLSEFEPTTSEELHKIIRNSPFKTSSLDPIPSSLLKDVLPEILPQLVELVNLSLATGVFPDEMKLATITPILKKQGADNSDLKNFRPVSNLSYFSKLLERVIAARLNAHLTKHGLHNPNQSAYRPGHSVETALTSIADSIFRSLDSKEGVVMVLLDLSAAFDTIDHSLLLERLRDVFGIGGIALAWFQSYLSNRSFRVRVGDSLSEPRNLKFGVPQGSVLGPLLFSCYTQPLANIMCNHDLSSHQYADDTQNWCAFKVTPMSTLPYAITKVETCLSMVRRWMGVNRLKLNDLKTEFLILMSPSLNHARPVDAVLHMGPAEIQPSSKARNLGFIFDNKMTFHEQISQVVSTGYFHLRKIASIKKYIPIELLSTLTHAFITSRLDFCNALYYGLPQFELNRLQKLQNQAARLVTNTKRREHITPVLRQLHWLPVKARIEFKILTLAFRAVHSDGPAYLQLPLSIANKSTRASSAPGLAPCRSRMRTAGDRAYSVCAPQLWNQLPVELRLAENITTFKRGLKTSLFNRHFL